MYNYTIKYSVQTYANMQVTTGKVHATIKYTNTKRCLTEDYLLYKTAILAMKKYATPAVLMHENILMVTYVLSNSRIVFPKTCTHIKQAMKNVDNKWTKWQDCK